MTAEENILRVTELMLQRRFRTFLSSRLTIIKIPVWASLNYSPYVMVLTSYRGVLTMLMVCSWEVFDTWIKSIELWMCKKILSAIEIIRGYFFLCCLTYGDKIYTMNSIRKKLMKALYVRHRGWPQSILDMLEAIFFSCYQGDLMIIFGEWEHSLQEIKFMFGGKIFTHHFATHLKLRAINVTR